ncbi:L-alanine exporter AlaE [Affinibrenneria salicis]|uniref:L-alanine exporter AlaE n=1 Tax=Affinibrenneria salicis TaxID=2590031 RepID=A0A5J5G8G0_9GAMM|nr:L-alanine exporter AlaE [Affinibrenneria salicis]KAA9003294.1 L-alanine exporter AlaE [Affinibrenneria salicis]KAA9003324.1 L-alanine exporter AlaE [Affinibrenneria salicis]
MFSPASRLRSAAADTFALVIYCFITGMIIEMVLSGMTFQQSLSSRLLSIPVNIVIAWPYGLYRDRVLALVTRRRPSHSWLRNLADLLAYVSFQSPVYAAILWVIGAGGAQIVTAVSSNAVISMAMGVLYGYFLEYCRRLFHVPLHG